MCEKDKIGKIMISIDKDMIYKVDIFAKEAIRKKGIGDYLIEMANTFLNLKEILIA